MIGTLDNEAVLYVEVIFWSGKRKNPPSLISGKYSPHFVAKGKVIRKTIPYKIKQRKK